MTTLILGYDDSMCVCVCGAEIFAQDPRGRVWVRPGGGAAGCTDSGEQDAAVRRHTQVVPHTPWGKYLELSKLADL